MLFLLGFILVSCSSPKILKTDVRDDIDLSGRWNDTDAEIASNELFNNLLASNWLKAYEGTDNLKTRIEVEAFGSNFKNGGESLQQYFEKYLDTSLQFELISKKSEKVPEFQLFGEIMAKEVIQDDEQNFIYYTVRVQLKNMNGEMVWDDSTQIKKYIKDRL